jgi:hypothetical protein
MFKQQLRDSQTGAGIIEKQAHVRSAKAPNVQELAKELGLKFEELSYRDLSALVAACNVENYIVNLKGSTIIDQINKDANNSNQQNIGSPEQQLTSPENNIDTVMFLNNEIRPARSLSDLPYVLPQQRRLLKKGSLLTQLSSGRFFVRTIEAEIFQSKHNQESIAKNSQSQGIFPEARILFDTSKSMNNHDFRALVALGLGLSYLRHAFQLNAHVSIDFFQEQIKSTLDSEKLSRHEFLTKFLQVAFNGTTNLQRVLNQASEVADSSSKEKIDTILITDGLSEVSQKPSSKILLHTFLLGDLDQDDTSKSPKNSEILATKKQLKNWCDETSFEHLEFNLKDLLILSPEQTNELGIASGKLLSKSQSYSPQELRLKRNLEYLLTFHGADTFDSRKFLNIYRHRFNNLPSIPEKRDEIGTALSVSNMIEIPEDRLTIQTALLFSQKGTLKLLQMLSPVQFVIALYKFVRDKIRKYLQ